MCGYSGFVFVNKSEDLTIEKFKKNAHLIAHRGNDDAQHFIQENVWLSHYRLAFQDVAGSKQPFLSYDSSKVIVFNGEIYNHFELREKILQKNPKLAFATRGDTETLLYASMFLSDDFTQDIDGEYAFVTLSKDGSEIFAARDAFGVKPLFFAFPSLNTRMFSVAQKEYHFKVDSLFFGSEIKSLACKKQFDKEGLARQFVGLYEPICTPYQNIVQLPPGGKLKAKKQGNHWECTIYLAWNPIRNLPQDQYPAHSWRDLKQEFSATISKSVESRLLSDVELGVYLSGGIDSKAIAFELSQQLKKVSTAQKPLKTFTVGFTDEPYDETREALDFAKHLGFDAHYFKVTPQDLAETYPQAVYFSENIQPYTNGAAKMLLSGFTRQYVKGVLTGDGADEVFGGYASFQACAWWKFAHRKGARPSDARFGHWWRDSVYVKKFRASQNDPWLAGSSSSGLGTDFHRSLEVWNVPHPFFDQVKTLAEYLMGEDAEEWIARQGESVRSWYCVGLNNVTESFLTDPQNALYLWQNYFCKTHLPVQILNWVGDRMEMANSLEGRTPYLSKYVREFLKKCPDSAFLTGFRNKAILRETYQEKFPRTFARVPKKQFGAPFFDLSEQIKQYDVVSALKHAGFYDAERWQHIQSDSRSSLPFQKMNANTFLQTAVSLAICENKILTR